MDNLRLILFFALTFVVFLTWEAWQADYGPKPVTASSNVVPAPAVPTPKDVPTAAVAATPPAAAVSSAEVPAAAPQASGQRIHVVTDTLDIEIDSQGGDIRQADLLGYPVSLNEPVQPVRLLRDATPNLFVMQSGLLSNGSAPDHYAPYNVAQTEYQLAAGQNELRVPMTWTSADGLTVTKTYILHRGSHVIDVEFKVTNNSATEWQGRQYRQMQRTPPESGSESRFIYTYTGGVLYSNENKYEKIEFDDMKEQAVSRDIKGGWAAMIQHYFLAAILPGENEENHYYSKAPGDERYVLGLVSPAKTIAAGASDTFATRYYIGPKEQAVLADLAPGLDLTVDYGMLTVISKPLFWVLGWFERLFGNWGWAILMVTLIIKLAFYPLSSASYRSMANMRKFAPKLQQLKERYGDDRQKMTQAMMELYKKEKINPLGGCLPMIVQIPVFIALYWVLLESVELRQAPFIFWINDLAVRDPYYVLPLLMGVSMFIQQKLNPPPPDPVQAKILMALPIIFTLFFAFFPAGLVLYWLANSVLSVAQQWYITHKVENAAKAAETSK